MAETTKAATHDCGCGADHHHGPADESVRPEPARLSPEGQAALTAAAEALGLIIRLHDREPDAALVRGLNESEVDVVKVGLGPTPMLYYAEATLEVDGASAPAGGGHGRHAGRLAPA